MEFKSSDVNEWKDALSAYESRIESLINKPNLVSIDKFSRNSFWIETLILSSPLPSSPSSCNGSSLAANGDTLSHSLPLLCIFVLLLLFCITPFIRAVHSVRFEVSNKVYMKPRLLDFVSSLDEVVVKSASQKAFQSLPDVSKAISELTVLKGIGPATASLILAAYAPDVAPFMSDEAMVAVLGNSKDYTLKQYLLFTEKLQAKAKELSAKGDSFTPSDAERALWSSAVGKKSVALSNDPKKDVTSSKISKRKGK